VATKEKAPKGIRSHRESQGKRRSSKRVLLTPIQKVLLGKGMMANRKEPVRRVRRMRDGD
jgi:hypothetical protein